MSSEESNTLELFETEFAQEFPRENITSIADYNQNILTGNSSGIIKAYKKENSKLEETNHIELKSKIDKLVVVAELDILYVLSGGNLYLYNLPSFNDKTPKDSDKESKDLKDIVKIIENQDPKNKQDLMIITKKKKIIFFSYITEMQRLLYKEYFDEDKKQLVITL